MDTDSYAVRFSIQQPNGFWKREERIYVTNGKNKHSQVKKAWEKDFRNKKVKLIGIYYQ